MHRIPEGFDSAEELESDLEWLRQSYNTAIANGLVLKAERINKIIKALEQYV